MTKIVNLTPHELVVYSVDSCDVEVRGNYTTLTLKNGAEPMLRIPSSGVARAESHEEKVGTIGCGDGISIPEMSVTFGEPVGLPEQFEADTVYIVSAITAQSCKIRCLPTDQLRLVSGTVRDANGRIVGCTALARV